jgi:hypothetical protein
MYFPGGRRTAGSNRGVPERTKVRGDLLATGNRAIQLAAHESAWHFFGCQEWFTALGSRCFNIPPSILRRVSRISSWIGILTLESGILTPYQMAILAPALPGVAGVGGKADWQSQQAVASNMDHFQLTPECSPPQNIPILSRDASVL